MQSSAWAALFRQIPPEQHDQFSVVTASGTEIALNSLLRIDHEFIAVKGRLSGSQDTGRIFLIPYSVIDYLGSMKPMAEAVFDEVFGRAVGEPIAPVPPAEAAAPSPTNDSENGAAITPTNRTPMPLKSAVLEKFRSRASGPGQSHNGTTLRPGES
jgi:hypothetical protein